MSGNRETYYAVVSSGRQASDPLQVSHAYLVGIVSPGSLGGGFRVEVGPNVLSAGPWARYYDESQQREIQVLSLQNNQPTALNVDLTPFNATRLWADFQQVDTRTFTVYGIRRAPG